MPFGTFRDFVAILKSFVDNKKVFCFPTKPFVLTGVHYRHLIYISKFVAVVCCE